MAWADKVHWELKTLHREAANEIWSRWMKDYWSRRIDEIPVTLSGAEVGVMAGWSIDLKPVFPEVVRMIIESPTPAAGMSSSVFHQLVKEDFAEQFPTDTAMLLVRLLEGETGRSHRLFDATRVRDRLIGKISLDLERSVKEELIRLGVLEG